MKKDIQFTLGILTLSYCLKVTRFWNGITDQWWMYHLNKSGVLLLIRQRKSTSLFVIILPGKNELNDFELMRRYESFRVLFEALLSPYVRDFGFRNPGNFALGIWLIGEIFACGIQKPGLWNREYSSRNPESYLRLESAIQYLESGIHGVESSIQDCLGFPYVGRAVSRREFLRTRNKYVLKFQEPSNSRFIGDTFSWDMVELKFKLILKRLSTRRSLKERYQTVLSKEKVWSAVIDLKKTQEVNFKMITQAVIISIVVIESP